MLQPPKTIIHGDLLEYCQALQTTIDYCDSPQEKDAAGKLANEALKNYPTDFRGSKELALRALEVYALPDGLTQESDIWPVVRYPQMWMAGELGRVVYIGMNQVRTIAWMLVNVSVLSANAEEIPVSAEVAELDQVEPDSFNDMPLELHTRLDRPLYLPVGVIETVFPLS